jgi:mersacidin/lichenicidin family type 2 lantibiotic
LKNTIALTGKEIIMSTFDIIRAWKDEDYRLGLSNEQRATLPASPVGLVELSDADMGLLAGGGSYYKCKKSGSHGKSGKHYGKNKCKKEKKYKKYCRK